jgi:hypothetical protein
MLEARYATNVSERDAQSAAEGNAAHYVAAELLHGRRPVIGSAAPNGIVIDDEMFEAAEMFVTDVRDTVGNAIHLIHIEETVRAPGIHPNNWGTPDVWYSTVTGRGGVLYIWDFKYGHRFVDAFENWQLLDYLACILSRDEFSGVDRRNIKFILRVVQPRNFHPSGPIREWEPTAVEIAVAFGDLEKAAVEAMGPTPTTRTGTECRDCRARHACPALHEAADGVADMARGASPLELPPAAVGIELRVLHRAQALIDARVTGLEAQALNAIRSGQDVPFYTVGQSQSRERWTVPPEQVIALGDSMGVKLAKDPQPITPNQARAAGMDADIVKGFAERPSGALKLVPADTTQARKVFGK